MPYRATNPNPAGPGALPEAIPEGVTKAVSEEGLPLEISVGAAVALLERAAAGEIALGHQVHIQIDRDG